MHAMQYEITLPADYDMAIIRKRVETRGHLLDDFPGLGLKAYLMRERGVAGSPVNQYAPCYLWNTPQGMNSFLWGPGFQGIVDDFGRPEVQHWAGLAYDEGPASHATPRSAVRRRTPLAGQAPLAEVTDAAVRDAARIARQDGAVCAAVAVDPRHWELLTFSLWDHASPDTPGDLYEVLHLSAPERHRLPRGRHW
ncbi:DUF4865 family protein [Streptomyces sp. NBC_01361]|uniref:DUF4865 family protein n=1 Tax=Streptomyces sp. NBC_01361 TaxID=2903838 RepID=UPI002E35046C|nr:DUF4865 family protein [Streptomyces sp. NBC_01361]